MSSSSGLFSDFPTMFDASFANSFSPLSSIERHISDLNPTHIFLFLSIKTYYKIVSIKYTTLSLPPFLTRC
ncbi:hypothetical protein [Candidatus Nitrosocosmicus arcticus]|uniref:hypothetical protein n=1 Tax=Candidatus Nitrosocosmicus arcticus TaxID=2035267 RepID=UPI00119FF5DE|nr:hypothetical protein [Candidatus Nitrosocosmicus arcticus]